ALVCMVLENRLGRCLLLGRQGGARHVVSPAKHAHLICSSINSKHGAASSKQHRSENQHHMYARSSCINCACVTVCCGSRTGCKERREMKASLSCSFARTNLCKRVSRLKISMILMAW